MKTQRNFRLTLVLCACALSLQACDLFGFGGSTPPLITGGSEADQGSLPAKRSIVVSAFAATFQPAQKSTSYGVTAVDPAGGDLTYVWTNSNSCGEFNGYKFYATWKHPDGPGGVDFVPGPCPKEDAHPGVITVVITSSKGAKVSCSYAFGSASGTQIQCETP